MTDTTPAYISGKRNIWVGGLLMLLMAIAYHVSGMLLALGAIVQFVLALLSDGPNARLLAFGRNLGRYLGQIADFVTFAAEDVSFPFGDWPSGRSSHGLTVDVSEVMTRNILDESHIHPAIRETIANHHADIIREVQAAMAANDVVVVGMKQNPFPEEGTQGARRGGRAVQVSRIRQLLRAVGGGATL